MSFRNRILGLGVCALHVVVCSPKHPLFAQWSEIRNASAGTIPKAAGSLLSSLPREFKLYSLSRFRRSEMEPLGTKAHAWYRPDESDRLSFLYKRTRENTGEAWVEKLTADLAAMIGLQHARQYLCREEDSAAGVLSLKFVMPEPLRGKSRARKALRYISSSLMEGNRILHLLNPKYDMKKVRGQVEAAFMKRGVVPSIRKMVPAKRLLLPNSRRPVSVRSTSTREVLHIARK